MDYNKNIADAKADIKEFCEVLFLRLYDKLENIESNFCSSNGRRNAMKNNSILLDNADLMEITQLSYSSLKGYRKAGLLIPNASTSPSSKNLYTLWEVERFLTEVLGSTKKIHLKRQIKEKYKLIDKTL